MEFSERLKKVMQQLGISQRQLVGLTGVGKSSISQYLSGRNIPTEKRQEEIALSLGLKADYFRQDDEPVVKMARAGTGTVQKLDIPAAARMLQMNQNTVRKGLQQGVFPWGYAIRTSEHRWVYFINARRFAEIEGMEVLTDE
jgi:transcriptional regulator with XRE-family HTH domain